MRKTQFKQIEVLRNVVFFLNVFLALLIITSSFILVKTTFGTAALFFGFLMLGLSTLLKVVQRW